MKTQNKLNDLADTLAFLTIIITSIAATITLILGAYNILSLELNDVVTILITWIAVVSLCGILIMED